MSIKYYKLQATDYHSTQVKYGEVYPDNMIINKDLDKYFTIKDSVQKHPNDWIEVVPNWTEVPKHMSKPWLYDQLYDFISGKSNNSMESIADSILDYINKNYELKK